MDIKLIIPARYQSTRFPGKPLVPILGVPMIKRVYNQCIKALDASCVYVATDSERIKDYCENEGIQVILTGERCLTGTDRVAEVAEVMEGDVFLNVQGDEPVFNPGDIKCLIEEVKKDPSKVYSGYTAIDSEEDFRNFSVPKMVFSSSGRLLYTSRSSIPGNKIGDYNFGFRQVCAYAFPRDFLRKFSEANKKGELEETEDLELLRFLEMDLPVYMVEMSGESIPVDHPEDVIRVENEIKNRS